MPKDTDGSRKISLRMDHWILIRMELLQWDQEWVGGKGV